MMTPLPNATTVLVLGIMSIVACWCFGLVGLIMGIIALVMASKEYNDNPGQYSESSYKNMQAGKICAIIGTCLSALSFIYFIVYLLIVGTVLSFIPWGNLISM